MKLQIAQSQGWNVFTAYGEGYVDVNAVRHGKNIVVTPERVIENWTAADFESLSLADFNILAALDAETILLGAGATLRFPRPELLAPLMRARKGFEIMDNHAACRTYNILAGEGRKVAAALILG
ncbi:MAG: Mth938-like domain-containing protein [Candidatus Accumulibacter sp.]|jgi:uncharacterized protein|nr:Mth938-like domain-containing protein [Accumulibacter sp.]